MAEKVINRQRRNIPGVGRVSIWMIPKNAPAEFRAGDVFVLFLSDLEPMKPVELIELEFLFRESSIMQDVLKDLK